MINNVSAAQHILGTFNNQKPTTDKPGELRSQLWAMMTRFFATDTDLPNAKVILEAIFGGGHVDPSTLVLNDRDRLLAQNLMKLKDYLTTGAEEKLNGGTILRSTIFEDHLASKVDEWTLFRVLNLAVMSTIPSTKDVSIVTSVRNEGLSILEWLAYHRSIGFNSFFVYTNDNADRSDRLLRILAEEGIITLIENDVAAETKVQTKILEHSLHLLPNLRSFKWVFYIDVDEFFISRCEPGLTLQSFLAHYSEFFVDEEPSAVCFNWKWFGSENELELSNGLLLERFTYSRHNEHVKSLVKLRDVVSMHKVHVPLLTEGSWAVDSNLTRVSPSTHLKPTYGTGQLNHYWNKSFKEFILKRSRGRISAGIGGTKLEYSSFFDWGLNGKRGNFDPPPSGILERTKQEYEVLLSIGDVRSALNEIRIESSAMLEQIDKEINIRNLWERRGHA